MARRKSKKTWKTQILLASLVASSVIMKFFVFLLILTMMPTIVAFFTDKTRHKTKVISIAAMNLAGASPFLLEVLTRSGDFSVFSEIASSSNTYLVSYGASAVGVIINWAAVGAVSTMLFQKGQRRLKRIEIRQKELVERWGGEVAGKIAIDQDGRPVGQEKRF